MVFGMNRTKILHISTPDVLIGAGIIPYDLHRLLCRDFDSLLVVSKTKVVDDAVVSYFDIDKFSFLRQKLYQRCLSFLNKGRFETNKDYCFDQNYGKPIVRVDHLLERIEKPDVIIAYFMSGFFSFVTLNELQEKTGAPILLYFMDMAYLTGGCHYAWDCEGYKAACEDCPAVVSKHKKTFVSEYFRNNIHLINKMNIIPIAPSHQLFEQIESSTLFKTKPIQNILLGMDHSVFKKKDKKNLRAKYGIPENKFVILFGSRSQSEKRKGWMYIIKIFERLKEVVSEPSNVLLLSIGDVDNNAIAFFESKNVGYVDGLEGLSDVYNLADVYVVPSIQDSGPSMVNQSISCGTPVVSFDIGVSQDLVINGKTGYRVKLYDSGAVAECILKIKLLNNIQYGQLSERCIKLAAEKTSLEKQAESFKALINTVVSNNANSIR